MDEEEENNDKVEASSLAVLRGWENGSNPRWATSFQDEVRGFLTSVAPDNLIGDFLLG